jgi:NAD(P)-dependent dehydrogenase (short-subunit alcohol dehydrogenase family)
MAIKSSEVSNREFHGRTAIVTGGATGIGRAIAINLATRGANVVIGSRVKDRSILLVDLISSEQGNAIFVETDVADGVAVKSMVDHAVDRFGSLDMLVNNSGIETEEGSDGPSEADWDRMSRYAGILCLMP